MYSDTHLHTEFSGDSITSVKAQIQQAVSLGMKSICITDHHDHDVISDTDFELNLDAYLPFLTQMQKTYADKIRIDIGIELGLQLHIKEYLEKLTKTYTFDYVLGSCHFIDGLDPYFPSYFEGRTEEEGYRRYFEVTLNRVKHMDCFDCLGHLDYVVRYGPNKNQNYCYTDYQEVIDEILKTLIAKEKGLECNTGGYKYGLGHPNPCEDILIRYRKLGGEIITIGSDAHAPEHVGYDFQRAGEVLKECGFRYYTVFRQRKPVFQKL